MWVEEYNVSSAPSGTVFTGELGIEKGPLRILSASGQLGYGIPEKAFRAGLERDLHMIGADMGSVDPGPYYLGAGKLATARRSTKPDLKLALTGALAAKVRARLPARPGSTRGSVPRAARPLTRRASTSSPRAFASVPQAAMTRARVRARCSQVQASAI